MDAFPALLGTYWLLATIATAWPLLAVAAGTIIGRSIRHADQQTTR